jgi:hypothetical protein
MQRRSDDADPAPQGVEYYDRAMDHSTGCMALGSARVMALVVHPTSWARPPAGVFPQNLREHPQKPDVLFWTGAQIHDWYLWSGRKRRKLSATFGHPWHRGGIPRAVKRPSASSICRDRPDPGRQTRSDFLAAAAGPPGHIDANPLGAVHRAFEPITLLSARDGDGPIAA